MFLYFRSGVSRTSRKSTVEWAAIGRDGSVFVTFSQHVAFHFTFSSPSRFIIIINNFNGSTVPRLFAWSESRVSRESRFSVSDKRSGKPGSAAGARAARKHDSNPFSHRLRLGRSFCAEICKWLTHASDHTALRRGAGGSGSRECERAGKDEKAGPGRGRRIVGQI